MTENELSAIIRPLFHSAPALAYREWQCSWQRLLSLDQRPKCDR